MVRVSEVPTRLFWPSNDRTAQTLDQEVPVNDHTWPSIDQIKKVNPILHITLGPSIPAAEVQSPAMKTPSTSPNHSPSSPINVKTHKPIVEEGAMLTVLDKATVRTI